MMILGQARHTENCGRGPKPCARRESGAVEKRNLVAYRQYAGLMPVQSTAPYPFGDLLALARQSWLGEMASRLAGLGYDDYRRTDAAATRLLRRGPVPVGRLGAVLGVTRQAARKVADGLEQRGYATTRRDPRDSRQLNVTLTPAGQHYARAVVAVIEELNREVSQRTVPAELAAADTVLRAALFDDSTRQRAARVPRPHSPDMPTNPRPPGDVRRRPAATRGAAAGPGP
jgi:DNA-binding MarR family transcriptional regulator